MHQNVYLVSFQDNSQLFFLKPKKKKNQSIIIINMK